MQSLTEETASHEGISSGTSVSSGPIPMSFPAVLRSAGLTDRFAHLRVQKSGAEPPAVLSKKGNRRDDKEGKRWIRRKENARFAGNPHVVDALKKDYAIPTPDTRSTFPQPLPSYLSRHNVIPAAVPGMREPGSANAGRFSLGMKGMRKELRKSGPRAELLVKEVEEEIMTWLGSAVWLNPDNELSSDVDGIPIGTSGSIIEVSHTPLQLVWSITDDAFARYVVHCCARYHSIVSFSKDVSGRRLTYLLRPNTTRPAFDPIRGLDTPPVTDLESSVADSGESDFMFSDRDSHISDLSDIDSDAELGPGVPPTRVIHLSNIPESGPGSPAGDADDSWSVINESDVDADIEHELANSVSSLDLDPDVTPRAARQVRQGPLRSHLWERQRRSASSPSRSPARVGRNPPRVLRPAAVVKTKTKARQPQSFFNYLYA